MICIFSSKKDKTRILVADDDKNICNIIESALRQYCGLNMITCVYDGAKALSELSKNHYDLFITGTHMAGLNGFEVIDRYKRSLNDKDNNTKYLASSRKLSDNLKNIYYALAVPVIPKPFLEEELTTVVQAHLSR